MAVLVRYMQRLYPDSDQGLLGQYRYAVAAHEDKESEGVPAKEAPANEVSKDEA